MGVCRRIFKHYEPSELTICVTICCDPRSPPRFDHWNISKPGQPPKIISCSRDSTTYDENRERRSRRKIVKKGKKSDVFEKLGRSEISEKCDNIEVQILSDQPLLHSDSSTLISNDVAMMSSPEISLPMDEPKELESTDRAMSVTSLDSVAGLGGMMSMPEDSDDVVVMRRVIEETNSEETKKVEKEEPKLKGKQFDLASNGDVDASEIQSMINSGTTNKKKVLVRRKKKSTTPESAPRYRDFTETSIYMCIEMNKENIGEFVWDQKCTRIDALAAPISELNRTTTPEIPVEIQIFD
ncbi:Protein CBG12420 [Caenorhabditis briggsae]|nr:Protein CBG12420 [Caenorhabditis briggsae]ULU12267.1 hypothetical protein L3Y34_015530 [Caenorhabditis briggsae]CAP31403.1 Protein CBG12420 [Caenorhabditis briggsae]